MRAPRNLFFAALLAWAAVGAPQILAATYPSPPIRLSIVRSVRLSPEVGRLGTKLRIRNLSSGASIVVNIDSNTRALPDEVLLKLVGSNQLDWLPEFSVLQEIPEALEGRAPMESRRRPQEREAKGERWRVLGYRVLKPASGGPLFIEVSDGVKTVYVTAEQAARRLGFKEKNELRKLFDLGWRSLEIQRYDLGQEAFEKILKTPPLRLDETQLAGAHLGMALSLYHREGCSSELDRHLVAADRDEANRDDVSYYRALCAMAADETSVAEVLFRGLANKRHPNYHEASSFYLGIIAELDSRYDEALAAYIETIDFATDPSLVTLATTRRDHLRELQSFESLYAKWIWAGISLGIGYDNNVAALPAEVSPASVSLSDQASIVSNDLMFLSLVPPWSRSFTHKLNYSFLFNKHLDSAVGTTYDSYAHDVGTQIAFDTATNVRHTLGYAWTSIALGAIGNSTEALRTQSASYVLKLGRGRDPAKAESDWDIGFKYSTVTPLLSAMGPEKDLTASAYQISLRIQQRRDYPHIYGPEFSVESRVAKGAENTLWDFRSGMYWDYYFGRPASPWYVTQVGSFSYKPYYRSELGRHDYTLAYVGAFGRAWTPHFDTRLQFAGTYNFSTLRSVYQYQQAAASFLVTLLF